jgi:homoserine kinase
VPPLTRLDQVLRRLEQHHYLRELAVKSARRWAEVRQSVCEGKVRLLADAERDRLVQIARQHTWQRVRLLKQLAMTGEGNLQ